MLSKLRRRKKAELEPPPEEDPLAEFDSDFDGGPTMGFFEHIEELRTRLVRAGLALIICTTIAIIFTGQILEYLIVPYEERLQIVGPTESVVVYFRVALMCGAIFSMPVITWQLFGFIMPGLSRKEKRWVLVALPGATLFFLTGVAFAWFIMTPAALHFLANFQSDVFFVEWTADAYIAFVTSLLFWIGAAFETPIIFFVLARFGLVGPRALIRNWRVAIVGTAIAAALITPTIDPFNMALVMGPLLALYVVSIIFVAFAYRKSGMSEV